MKKIFSLTFSLICLSLISKAQNIAINTDGSVADASSILDVKSTTKGMLVPRMTTTQRTAITTPATGLLVFDTDTKSFWFYNGAAWTNISGSGSGSFTLPYNGSTSSSASALSVLNTGAGAAVEGSGSGGAGVYGNSFNGAGVNALSTNGFGLIANSTNSTAIYGFNANGYPAIRGVNSNGDGLKGESAGFLSAGVKGISTSQGGYGVYGDGYNTGVIGKSQTGVGIRAESISGIALDVNGALRIAGGNTNPSNGAVLTSDANGNAVWKKNNIAFGLTGANTFFNTAPSGQYRKVQFSPTDYYDFGNNYNLLIGTNVTPTSSSFTAPVTGIYHFDASVSLTLYDEDFTGASLRLVLNRAGAISFVGYGHATLRNEDYFTKGVEASISRDIYMQAGDIIHVEIYHESAKGSSAGIDNSAATFFNGRLVFAQ